MNNFDQEIMARTAIGEARGDGNIAMQAVMWTGLNRFNSKRRYAGQSIAGTFLRASQYSCWLQHDPNYALITNITPDIGLLHNALQWANAIAAGRIPDPTLGATHYYADSIVAPDWVAGAEFTAKIGRQLFYKGVA